MQFGEGVQTFALPIFLTKNFRKFLKMKNSGKSLSKGKFLFPKGDRKGSRRKMGRILNPFKESCAINVTVMDISRRSVPTI